MSEKLIANNGAEGHDQGNLENEQKIAQYKELNDNRLLCEDDARNIAIILRKEYLNKYSNNDTETDNSKYEKFKMYFELDESILADTEKSMRELESELSYKPDRSGLYNDNKNDVLVNSAILYHDRIEALKSATGNQDVDNDFVKSIVEYARAVEHDSSSYMMMRFEDDIVAKQEYIERCQKRRSMFHNRMIENFNELNDLCDENDIKPSMYRNLATNSAASNFKNDDRMYHDRVTLAHYVSEVIKINNDVRFPDHKYIEET